MHYSHLTGPISIPAAQFGFLTVPSHYPFAPCIPSGLGVHIIGASVKKGPHCFCSSFSCFRHLIPYFRNVATKSSIRICFLHTVTLKRQSMHPENLFFVFSVPLMALKRGKLGPSNVNSRLNLPCKFTFFLLNSRNLNHKWSERR